MSLNGSNATFIPFTLSGLTSLTSNGEVIDPANYVKYVDNTNNTNLDGYNLATTGIIEAGQFDIPSTIDANSEEWSIYTISTMGNLSTLGGLVFTETSNGRSMYFSGGVVGAPNFQFDTLGSANASKVLATNEDKVFSTTINVEQLNYITGLTSQAGGVEQSNTWSQFQLHNANVSTTGSNRFEQGYNATTLDVSTLVNRATLDAGLALVPNLLPLSNTWTGTYNQFNGIVSTMGSNKFLQPYNATTLDISTLVNRATLDGAIAGLGAGILNLDNIWGYANTNNLNGGLKSIQNATQFNPSLDANSYFVTGIFPTTYVFSTNWIVNPVSGTTANITLDPAVFYFDANHKYVISFTGIYGTSASWVGTVFNNSTSLTVSDASIAITTSPQNLTMTFTTGSSNPTIYLRFVGASGTLRWTNFTIKEVDVEILGNLTLSSDIDSNIVQSNGRTANVANGLKVNQTSVATAPTLTTASLPAGVSASTLSGAYTLTATAGGTTFGMWLGSSFTFIAGAKYTYTFTGFSTNATATQAMILYTNTYTGGVGTFIGDYIVNVPITSSTVSGFFTATSNNNVVFSFVSSASGRSISFATFTLTRADTEIPSNLYAPRITTATSIAMTTAGGTLTMASNGRVQHASFDNSYTLYGPNSSWGKYLAVGSTPDVGNVNTAQVIGTNGDLFLDAANSKSIYYGNYQTSRGGTGTHEFYGNIFNYGTVASYGFVVNGGSSYVPGCIYSDANWGMLFRAKVVPAQGIFAWYDFAGGERMKILPNGQLQLTTVDGPGFVHTNGTVIVESYIGGAGGWFGTRTNHPLRFYTNNSSARMTLNTDGSRTHTAGDSSYITYGPNATWNANLVVGATPDRAGVGTAQVITTNGNLHLDAGNSTSMYYGFYANSRGTPNSHLFYGGTYVFDALAYNTYIYAHSVVLEGATLRRSQCLMRQVYKVDYISWGPGINMTYAFYKYSQVCPVKISGKYAGYCTFVGIPTMTMRIYSQNSGVYRYYAFPTYQNLTYAQTTYPIDIILDHTILPEVGWFDIYIYNSYGMSTDINDQLWVNVQLLPVNSF
jgi:hypothetical protein